MGMRMRLAAGLTAMVVGVSAAAGAQAAPGLANKVYAPYVRKGVTEVEIRGGRLTGGAEAGDSAAIVELEHGFSDRLGLAVLAELEDEPGDRRKLDALAVEGVVYLGQIPQLGVDVGAYVEYEQRLHNESGVLEGKLLLAKQLGPVHSLLNLIIQKPLSERDPNDARFGYAAQATVEVAPHLQLGAQAFGDLGTQAQFGGRNDHYLGPVAMWETRPRWMRGELEFEAAYLIPLGSAKDKTDGQVRFAVEYERRF